MALALIACGSEPTESPSRPPPAPPIEAIPPQRPLEPLPARTVWTGTYVCAQGSTALTLTIDLTPEGGVAAKFDFGPLPQNPDVPRGSYSMSGELALGTGGVITVKLRPLSWLRQPPNYIMVGIDGVIDRERRRLLGRIAHTSCAGVDLTRSN